MKLLTSKNEYVASNLTLKVTDDLSKVEAYSWGWWKFVATDRAGNIIFIDASYSSSTGRHQRTVRSKLHDLGIRPHLTLSRTRKSLCDIPSAIKGEISLIEDKIAELRAAIARKGSWKRVNAQRLESIKSLEFRIKDLTNYLENYIDKRPIPLPKPKLEGYLRYYDGDINRYNVKIANTYKPYFKKQNGKVNRNGFFAFLGKYKPYHEAPASIDGIKALFDLKATDDVSPILAYQHVSDIERMLPSVDSPEYKLLVRWAKRMGIGRDNCTIITVDKLHTYLVNKMNRKSYTPREPLAFPVHPKLRALDGSIDDLRVIKTDFELRAEGRKQSHCIGSKHYIEACSRGYQALNYKGYTFFLTPSLQVSQTHGRHNSFTPSDVRNELASILGA